MNRFLPSLGSLGLVLLFLTGTAPVGKTPAAARLGKCEPKRCVDGVLPKGISVSLIDIAGARFCTGRTGPGFETKQGSPTEVLITEFTELVDLKGCAGLTPDFVLFGKPVKNLRRLNSLVVPAEDLSRWSVKIENEKQIENEIRDEEDRHLLKTDEFDSKSFSLDRSQRYRVGDRRLDVLHFQTSKREGATRLILLAGEKKIVRGSRACGNTWKKPLEIDGSIYYFTESGCCSCDAWYVIEGFRFDATGPAQIF